MGSWSGLDHLRREPREEPSLGARDPVPRQAADRLEEGGAQTVVEIPGLELLRRQREIAPDVPGEVPNRFEGRRLGAFGNHDAGPTVRNFAYTYGYVGRNQLRKLRRMSSFAVAGEAPFIT